MSSNRDSPSEKSTKRSNKSRKNAVEYQERVLSQVREMFDSILEPDVILSVVQNCNWKLQPSIEYLISLSANINNSNKNNSKSYDADLVKDETGATADNPDSSPEEDAFEVDTDFTYLNINDEELQKQKDEFKKFELMRKHGQDVIRESPLEAIEDDFDNFAKQVFSSLDEIDITEDTLPCNQTPLLTSDTEGFSHEAFRNFHQLQNQESNSKSEEKRKTETESLCGLKVQYRFGGPAASSDDDADVVIEEESSDQTVSSPQNTLTNVCQFLSLSTESSPKTTCPQVEMISTASPSSSPVNQKFKAGYNATLSRIKSTIQRGFKIMVILRGLPGSGKTSLANNIAQSVDDEDTMRFIFSTDDFFMKKGKIYDFDRMKLSEAHAFNEQRVLKAAKEGISPIIVDNTNSQCWEMRPYVIMAVQYGYFIEVLEPNTLWAFNVNELVKRNVHGVQKQSIQRMLERFDRNITGAKLIKMFSLNYEPFNVPPQPCFNDLFAKKLKPTSHSNLEKTKKENKKYNRRNKKIFEAEEKIEDYVPTGFSNAVVVDAISSPRDENLTALQLAIKTFGGDDDDLSPKQNKQDLIQDRWDKSGVSWEDEQLKVDIKNKESSELKETLNEDSSSYRPFMLQVDDNVKNIHEVNELHLNLGAIGSERKNSIIKNVSANDSSETDNKNVLSPCWDFTLLLDEKQIHSVGPETENKSADEEKSNEDSSNNSTISDLEKSDSSIKSSNSEKAKSPTEELKEAANTLDKDSPDSGTKSTESFENIDSNSDDLLIEIREAMEAKETTETLPDCLKTEEEIENNPENLNTDPQAKVSFGSIMKFIKKSILGANNESSKNIKAEDPLNDSQIPKTSEIVIDSLTEKLHSPVKEHNSCKMKTLDYELETDLGSDLNDTLSKKLLKVARASPNNNTNLVYEAQGNFKCIDFLKSEVVIKTNDMDDFDHYCSTKEISSNESFINISDANDTDSSEKENLNDSNIENEISPTLSESVDKIEEICTKFESIKLAGGLAGAVLSLEENEKLILEEKELVQSNVQKSEVAELEFKNIEIATEKCDKNNQILEVIDHINSFSREESPLPNCEIQIPIKCDQVIDNINSISWKESPFPTYGVQVPEKKDPVEECTTIITSEASTNTNFYDFNVSFIGGTNESEYTLLDAFNRSINEGLVPSNLETPPPRKLKLDKSSMTNEVDILLQLPTTSGESEESEKEIIQGFIDMFPHLPEDYIVEVYQNLCKGDSHWAVDVLLDGVPSGGILKTETLKSVISENSSSNSSPTRNKSSESLKQSISTDSIESASNVQSRKKEKSHVSEDTLALKKYLEDKVIINESSYHPHILRVRKWKNGEPDVSNEEIVEAQARNKDVLQFINDVSPVEMEPPESPTNSEENLQKEKEESDGDDSSESDETVEFNLGWEFIKNLESQFGNTNFQLPGGFFPVIQLKKSLAQEIYSLWIESMQQQIDTQQEHLDAMIAKDAEYAKSLEEAEAKAVQESTVPNLNEVMDMELALAVYKNDLKKQQARETPNDLASRLTRQMLNEMFPNSDPETLSEILKAHNGNFKETVEVLEASTGQSLSSAETLNKQNSLMVKVKQQSLSKEDVKADTPSSSKNTDVETGELTYEQVLQTAHDSRNEAERQFLLRNANFNKAASAFRNGNPAVASYYSEMAKLHSKKMESANASAASAFLAAQTHVLGEDNTLDLHNLFVPEAVQALDIYLDHQLQVLNNGNKRSMEILIITGRGARSNNNKSKIKPAVSKRLTRRNIRFMETNPGCLKAKLYRHNSST